MVDATQTVLTVTVPTLAVLIGILVNNYRLSDMTNRFNDTNRRIDDLRADINARFLALESVFTEKLYRVEQVMDARLKHLEENR